MKYKKAIKKLNKAFKPRGIKFEDAGEGWKRYKDSVYAWKRKLKELK